ncbi:uncharacterized protein [Paramormyrops kingsleyae]|uniref:uncharacterized protein isoform X2 n=1 Tax=Paramormyrops kingsleyae TaxID=1676925 RepID=UPI003B972B09
MKSKRGCRMVAWLLLVLSFALCVPLVLEADSAIVCHTGDTVTLSCPGRLLNDTEELLWMFKGKPAFSYGNGSLCETGRYVSRTSIGSIQQNNFSLDITNISKEDAGVYTCRISGDTEHIRSISLIVNDTETDREQRAAGTQHGDRPVCRPYREREDPPGEREDPPGASSGGNRGLTVGIVVPVVLLVLVVVGVLIIKWRNRQGAERQEDSVLYTEVLTTIKMLVQK